MHIHPLRLSAAVVALVIVLMAMTGCRRGPVEARLDLADSLMESRPDSALTILDSISAADLRGNAQKARHALLLSMALDKNYIDTATFDVLQPAIDYYPRHGSPDEKLRTYYYQGRIYQNRGESDAAMSCFMNGKEYFPEATDTLTMANLLTVQGFIFHYIYNVEDYVRNNIEAADLYRALHRSNYEMDCLTHALNGSILKNDKKLADSILNIALKSSAGITELEAVLAPLKMAYTIEFGDKEAIHKLLQYYETIGNKSALSDIEHMNLVWAYYKNGDVETARQYIDSISQNPEIMHSLKFITIQPDILEATGEMDAALKIYKQYVATIDSIHHDILSHELNSMQSRHNIEMNNMMAQTRKNKIIWLCVCIVLILIVIVVFLFSRYRIGKAKIYLEKNENVRLQLENDNLQLRIEQLEEESVRLTEILTHHTSLEKPIEDAIKERIGMLNEMLASRISRTGTATVSYEEWIDRIVADKDAFMNSTRLAFKATHPKFMEYLEEHGLTDTEINYVCLYAIGLRGKEVGEYIRSSRHYHLSSDIRRKLGIDGHQTNIGIYIRKLMAEFDN